MTKSYRGAAGLLFVAATCAALACGGDGPAAVLPTGPDTIKPHGVVTYAFRDDSIIDVTLHATDNVAVTRVTLQMGPFTPEDSIPIMPGPVVDTRFSVTCSHLKTCVLLIFVHDASGNFDFANHSNEPLYPGPPGFVIDVAGVPANGVVDRVGIVLDVAERGPKVASVVAYLDSGMAQQRVYGADGSALRLLDLIPNGPHALTFVVTAGDGTAASFHKTISVAIASVAYHARILTVPGTVDATGVDVNNAGDVAGLAMFADSSTEAIRWDSGTPSVLAGGR
jgi:hypothetical protein